MYTHTFRFQLQQLSTKDKERDDPAHIKIKIFSWHGAHN